MCHRVLMKSQSISRRWVFYIISGLVAILAVCTLILFTLYDIQSEKVVLLTITWALVGITWAITGIFSNIITIKASKPIKVSRERLTGQLLPDTSNFVDRSGDSTRLVEALENYQIVNLHGRKGSGKSHFLAFASDIANKHRVAEKDHLCLNKLSKFSVVYFDLSEALGFDDILSQLFNSHLPDMSVSWENFVQAIDVAFGKTSIILILDNVNAQDLSLPLGSAVYKYIAHRPTDKVLLGSIVPVRFHNLPIHCQKFDGFNRTAIVDLAIKSGLNLNEESLSKVEQASDGLPLYLNLLFTHWEDCYGAPGGISSGLRELLGNSILPRLSSNGNELLVGIALLSVINPEVNVRSLERLPVDRIEEGLSELVAFSLLVKRERSNVQFVKIHDLIRDSVIEICDTNIQPIAQMLAIDAMNRDLKNESAIYWMFTDFELGDNRDLLKMLIGVVREAAATKNYPLLSTLALLSETRKQVKKLMLQNDEVRNALAYAQASSLAGAGLYNSSVDCIEKNTPLIFRKLVEPSNLLQLEFEIAYLHADLLHLQNRYDEALDSMFHLRRIAQDSQFYGSAAKIEWAIGHIIRHQGKQLDVAFEHFEMAEELARKLDDIYTVVFSATGMLGIQVYLKDIPEKSMEKLNKLEDELQDNPQYENYLPKIWKCQSQVLFDAGKIDEAHSRLAKAIAEALEMNDRLLFNYYFQRAEFFRFQGDVEKAVHDYLKVLEFGRVNGDRNLISNSLLGIAEAEASNNTLIHHLSEADRRSSVLQARAIAEDAGIVVTQRHAEGTLIRLEKAHFEARNLALF